jgi:hypothetical protein
VTIPTTVELPSVVVFHDVTGIRTPKQSGRLRTEEAIS